MIGSLAGVLTLKSPPQLLLEVAGVGYEIEAPMSTFYQLPALGQPVRLLTHLVVREDAHVLYGFATESERALFRGLLKVAGVGPRTALAILSGVTSAAFAQAVHAQDAAALMRIPGVGRKTAERLIVEMRDRLDVRHDGHDGPVQPASGERRQNGAAGEAYHALVSLGYKPQEATRLLKAAGADDAALATEELIRRALQSAVRE